MAQPLPMIPGYQFPQLPSAMPSQLQAALERVAAARAGAPPQPAAVSPGIDPSRLTPTPRPLPTASVAATAPTPLPRPTSRPPTVLTEASINPLPRGINTGGLINMPQRGGLITSGMPVTEVSGRMGQSGGGSDPFSKFAGSRTGQFVGDALTSFGLGLMGGNDWQEGLAMGSQHLAQTSQQRRGERKTAQTEGEVKTWLAANFPDLASLPPAIAMPLAQARFEAGLKPGPGPTALMQNLAAAGLVPGTPEYEAAILRGIDQGTTVTNNIGATDKFQDKTAELLATDQVSLVQAGRDAQSNNVRLGQLERHLARAPQGLLGAGVQLAGQFGIATEGLDDVQAATALISQMVPNQRPPGAGPISDADLALYKASLPSIINQPGGNAYIMQTSRAINDYAIAQAEIARKVVTNQLTVEQGLQLQASMPDPLADFKANGFVGGGATAPAGAIPPAPEGVDPAEWPQLYAAMSPGDKALWQ